MRNLPKKIIPVISVFLILFTAVTASASFSDDIKGGSTVNITNAEPFVATTFIGVDALYSLTESKYTSDELVVRFYKEAYKMNISAGASGPVMETDGYAFRNPVTPVAGDIVYASAEGHWAIVKAYTRGRITLFEQDAQKDGKAAVNRVVKYPSDSYEVFSPRAVRGNAYPTLKNADTGATVLIANGQYYGETTAPATDKTSETEEDESKTTKKEKTTKGGDGSSTDNDNSSVEYTTYKSGETSASPAAPVFTTEKMPDGYEEFLTSTTKRRILRRKETTTQESTTGRLTETE